MRGQIRGLDQASSNAQNAISLIGTGEGALNETHSILQRMRELAVQSSSDTNVGTDRKQIQGEVDELAKEISRISNDTEFNQKNLLGGNLADTYQVGANKDQNINLTVNAMDAQSLGVAADATVTTGTGAGNISTATFGSSVGANVIEGAVISAAYTTSVDYAGTASVLTGGTGVAADLSVIGASDNSVDVTIGTGGTAKVYTVNDAAIKGITGASTMDDVATALGNAVDGDGIKLSTVADVVNTAGVITITEKTNGATPITTAVAGTNKATVDGVFSLDAKTGVDGDAVTTAGKIVTLTDAGTGSQVINITDETAKTLDVSTGIFSGMKLDLGANAVSDLTGGDTVTVAQTITDSTAATFATDGTMTKAAVVAGIDVSSQTSANDAIKTINDAIETVSTERSKLGAYTNRLEHTIANLGTSSENLTSAESRIRDVDMAKEMSTFSKNNILNQAAQAMLAQANQQPQQVLALLR
jgi:flagellin